MIIGLVGRIGSGKNTAADILSTHYGFTQQSFAEPLKDIISILFGYPRHLMEGDTPESRQFRETTDPWWAERLGIPQFSPRFAMQYLGTSILRDCLHPDIWILNLERRIRDIEGNIVVTDCRFANECNLIERYGGFTLRIERGPDPEWLPVALGENADERMAALYPHVHTTEWKWLQFEQDYYVENNETVDELHDRLADIIGMHGQHHHRQPARNERLP